MIKLILLTLFIFIELYYWFIYFPKAWKSPGINKQIDDMHFAWDEITKKPSK